MPITTGFNHIATLTTDCDRHAAFYGDVFGAEVTFRMEATDDHPRMFILDMGGGSALNVFEVGPEDLIGEQRRQGGRGAIDHFGIAVDSLADARGGEAAAGRRRCGHRGHPATRRRVVAVLPRHRRHGARGLLPRRRLTSRC